MMTDSISDMLTRIRNGLLAKKGAVLIPSSKLKVQIANILDKENYVSSVKESEDSGKKIIEISLLYKEDGTPAISRIRRVSKPGLRVYSGAREIKPVLQGYGISIISTPQGLMTNKEAKRRGVGGEVICEVS